MPVADVRDTSGTRDGEIPRRALGRTGATVSLLGLGGRICGCRRITSTSGRYLEAGLTLDQFLENFPTVSREQAVRVLEHWRHTLRRLAQAS